jgi:hypothetical protein
MNPMLRPTPHSGDCRTHSLTGITYAELVTVLGEPNIEDDPAKVDASWGVEAMAADRPVRIGVWNYKNGPAYLGPRATLDDIDSWSVYAPTPAAIALCRTLFGAAFQE